MKEEASAEAKGAASNCEWMYGDTALGFLSRMNPKRWSGAISFEDAISQLTKELEKKDRPVVIKVPANTMNEHHFDGMKAGLEFLSAVDPAKLKLKEGELEKAIEVAAQKL